MLNLLATTGLTFAVLVAVFRPLELAFPAKPGQGFFRPGFFMDLCFFLGHHLFWGGIVFWLLLQLRSWVTAIVPPDLRATVAHQPWWLQAVEAVLLSDLFMYWATACNIGCRFCGDSMQSTTARNTWTGWPATASIPSMRFTR
jgi:hypothetical protein